jgi:chromate transporter
MDSSLSQRLREVARLFLKLGFTAFGGPAAHIAMMHEEVVKRRQWLTDQEFLDLVGATNLIPGPSSTEMAIHIGMRRAGWRGLIIGGLCFVVPAALIVLVLAWAYVSYGSTPQAAWLLYGVKPVVIAIIAQALYLLGRKAITRPLSAVVAVAVVVLYVAGVNEIALLFLGGIVVLLGANYRRLMRGASAMLLLPLPVIPPSSPLSKSGIFGVILGNAFAFVPSVPYSLPLLFLTFLKIGSVMYGSGYVLLAFLRADFVVRCWLTDQQLIDAIAIGQVTRVRSSRALPSSAICSAACRARCSRPWECFSLVSSLSRSVVRGFHACVNRHGLADCSTA